MFVSFFGKKGRDEDGEVRGPEKLSEAERGRWNWDLSDRRLREVQESAGRRLKDNHRGRTMVPKAPPMLMIPNQRNQRKKLMG